MTTRKDFLVTELRTNLAAQAAEADGATRPTPPSLTTAINEVWAANLPAELSVEQVKALASYRQDFGAAAATLAVEEMIAEAKDTHGDYDDRRSYATPDVGYVFGVTNEEIDDGFDHAAEVSIVVDVSDTMQSVIADLVNLW